LYAREKIQPFACNQPMLSHPPGFSQSGTTEDCWRPTRSVRTI